MELQASIEQIKLDIARLDTSALIKVRTLVTMLADLIWSTAGEPLAGATPIAVLVDRLHAQEEAIAEAVLSRIALDPASGAEAQETGQPGV